MTYKAHSKGLTIIGRRFLFIVPNISIASKVILGIPVSQSSSDPLFSISSNKFSPRRNKLHPSSLVVNLEQK